MIRARWVRAREAGLAARPVAASPGAALSRQAWLARGGAAAGVWTLGGRRPGEAAPAPGWAPRATGAVAGAEGRRPRTIHAAGEPTVTAFQGVTEGAAAQGVRAGGAVLADLRPARPARRAPRR